MSFELFMFPDPPDTTGIGTTSLGVKVTSRPFKHHTGRIGIAYDIPDNVQRDLSEAIFFLVKACL